MSARAPRCGLCVARCTAGARRGCGSSAWRAESWSSCPCPWPTAGERDGTTIATQNSALITGPARWSETVMIGSPPKTIRRIAIYGLLAIQAFAACAKLPLVAMSVASPAPRTYGGERSTGDARGVAVLNALARLPLQFEENRGQADASVKYLTRGPGYGLLLGTRDVTLATGQGRVRMTLVGAREDTHVTGVEERPGKVNYVLGRDPRAWLTGIATYGKVRYAGVYPGIDVVFYGNQRELEYDFVLAPGANPRDIVLRFADADSLTLDAAGDLVIGVGEASILQRAPRVFQEQDGRRVPVSGR